MSTHELAIEAAFVTLSDGEPVTEAARLVCTCGYRTPAIISTHLLNTLATAHLHHATAPPAADRACPYCGRLMSEREHREQRACNDCTEGRA